MNLDVSVALCKQFEGLYLKPYLCPAGVPTIGYGSTRYESGRKVTLNDSAITIERAEQLLLHDLRFASDAVSRLCPRFFAWSLAEGTWRAFNAITSFTYNLGPGRLQSSTLRRKLEAHDFDGAKDQLMLWVRGGGRVLPGLVKRRKAEAYFISET